jgi:hypothetical protein
MGVIFVYDILNNYIDCPEVLSLIEFRILIKKTRNSDLIYTPNI